VAGQPALVGKEKANWREAGSNGQDVCRGARESIGWPPLDLGREIGELSRHVDCGFEGIHAKAEDGKRERGGQTVAKERREPQPRGGDPFEGHEGSLGLGQSLGQVTGCEERASEHIAQPADHDVSQKN